MPISSQVNNAYIPRFYPELDENGVCETPRTVNEVQLDVQNLVAVPAQGASTLTKVLIIVGIIVGVCVAAALIITLSIVLTSTTTTTTTFTTVTTTTATTSTTTSAPAAPTNMMSYRGNINQNYTFTVTGTSGITIWGTTIYTDDSNIAVAAVHAGVASIGQTLTVTIMILAGQSSYSGTTQNGIISTSYSSWGGSYQFVISSG